MRNVNLSVPRIIAEDTLREKGFLGTVALKCFRIGDLNPFPVGDNDPFIPETGNALGGVDPVDRQDIRDVVLCQIDMIRIAVRRIFGKQIQKVAQLLSHDIAALNALCGEIMVLEQGQIIERAAADELFQRPKANWTKQFAAASKVREGGDWEWTAS